MRIVKCAPIRDKKNPSKFILKIVEPRELRGKIAFPIDFEPNPSTMFYVCEIVHDAPKYCRVRLHKCRFTAKTEFRIEFRGDTFLLKRVIVLECPLCGRSDLHEEIIDRITLDASNIAEVISWLEEKIAKYNIRDSFIEKKLQELKQLAQRRESIVAFYRELERDLKILESIAENFRDKYIEETIVTNKPEELEELPVEYVASCRISGRFEAIEFFESRGIGYYAINNYMIYRCTCGNEFVIDPFTKKPIRGISIAKVEKRTVAEKGEREQGFIWAGTKLVEVKVYTYKCEKCGKLIHEDELSKYETGMCIYRPVIVKKFKTEIRRISLYENLVQRIEKFRRKIEEYREQYSLILEY